MGTSGCLECLQRPEPDGVASESSTRALYLPEVNVNWATELPSPEQGFSFSGKCLRSSRKGLNSDWHPLSPPPTPNWHLRCSRAWAGRGEGQKSPTPLGRGCPQPCVLGNVHFPNHHFWQIHLLHAQCQSFQLHNHSGYASNEA